MAALALDFSQSFSHQTHPMVTWGAVYMAPDLKSKSQKPPGEPAAGVADHVFHRVGTAILYRGVGFDVVWPQFAAVIGIGLVFFVVALLRFRASLATQD